MYCTAICCCGCVYGSLVGKGGSTVAVRYVCFRIFVGQVWGNNVRSRKVPCFGCFDLFWLFFHFNLSVRGFPSLFPEETTNPKTFGFMFYRSKNRTAPMADVSVWYLPHEFAHLYCVVCPPRGREWPGHAPQHSAKTKAAGPRFLCSVSCCLVAQYWLVCQDEWTECDRLLIPSVLGKN